MTQKAAQAPVLILAPFGRDGQLLRELLEQETLASEVCANIDELCERCGPESGPLLLVEEVLTPAALEQLCAVIADQPEWSELPILVLVHTAQTQRGSQLMAEFGGANVSFIERPVRAVTLCSAVRGLVRARERQFQVRDLLEAYARSSERERSARAEAERALRIRDEFLSIASHELRTPLTVLLGNAALLQRQMTTGAIDQRMLADSVSDIERESQRLRRLVDDLLDTARIQQGRLLIQTDRMSLNDLVEDVLRRAALDPNLTSRHQLRYEDSGTVEGFWDRARLEQVVTNLVSNAIKYSPAGGSVTAAVGSCHDCAVLTVSDEGIGMDSEQISRLFEPFARVHDPSLLVTGTGLGLYIAQQLVFMHGGRIDVHSRPGRGSIFTVELPLHPEPEALTPLPRDRAQPIALSTRGDERA